MATDIKQRWLRISRLFASSGISQIELAALTGVDQSTISRTLARCPRRDGKAFKLLCRYAETMRDDAPRVRPAENAELMNALQEVWNGSAEHAHALAGIIRAAGYVREAGRR